MDAAESFHINSVWIVQNKLSEYGRSEYLKVLLDRIVEEEEKK